MAFDIRKMIREAATQPTSSFREIWLELKMNIWSSFQAFKQRLWFLYVSLKKPEVIYVQDEYAVAEGNPYIDVYASIDDEKYRYLFTIDALEVWFDTISKDQIYTDVYLHEIARDKDFNSEEMRSYLREYVIANKIDIYDYDFVFTHKEAINLEDVVPFVEAWLKRQYPNLKYGKVELR